MVLAMEFLLLSAIHAAKLKARSNAVTASLNCCAVGVVLSKSIKTYPCIGSEFVTSTVHGRSLTYCGARSGTAVSLTSYH